MQQISLSSAAGNAVIAEVVAEVSHTTSKWAHSHGTGDRSGCWALSGSLGRLVHRIGCCAIMLSFPVIAVYM